MKSAAVLGLVSLLLAACAGPSDGPAGQKGHSALAAALPGEFTARKIEGDAALGPWWADWGDPQLTALVEEGLRESPTLGAALARLEAAAAVQSQRDGDRWPSVSATLDGTRQRQVFVGLPLPGGPIDTTSNNFGLGLDVTWELDLWGRLAAASRAARYDFEASALDLAAATESLAAQLVRSWVRAAEANRLEELAENTLESRAETLETVRARFRRGLRPSADLHLAETELQTARALLEGRRLGAASQKRQLEALLGRYPEGKLTTGVDLPRPSTPVPRAVPAQLLAARPDLAAAEARLLAADERVAQRRAELYPRISLGGSLGTRSDDPADLLDLDFRRWSLFGNLVQPLFEGGRLRARVDEADANRRALLEDFAGLVLNACLEVELALATEIFRANEEGALFAALAAARDAETALLERYRAGLVELLDLQNAQRRTLELETRSIEVRARRLEARIDLHLALGGLGFDRDESPTTGTP